MEANTITIDVPGATPEETGRGIAAALAVFQAAGTMADETAAADVLRERLHEGGYYDAEGGFIDPSDGQAPYEGEVPLRLMTAREAELAPLWREADWQAMEACCAGWPAEKRPDTAGLSLAKA